MGSPNVAGFDAAMPGVARLARRRGIARRLRERVESFLGTGSESYERNFLIVRPAIALLVAGVVLAQGPRFPGRDGVLAACSIAVAYNFLLALILFKHRLYLHRAVSLVFDNATVLAASAFLFWRMGLASYETDIWLVFLIFIITSAMYYGPIGSMFFACLWTGWFLGVSVLFFEPDTPFREQLITRLAFFALMTFVALSLCSELRTRARKLEYKTRQTLTMLATIVEARDSDAGLHLRHIQHYSRALTLYLGMSEKVADEIAYAAMIHDVGKAHVSDAVLKKPGPLTPAEWREMRQHTVWGDELLAENEEFAAARQVARSHHEHWDGKGYPDGLSGEAIPLAARIVAVADVYDALISERPYKLAWPPDKAIAEIQRVRGRHLDPDMVDAFIELYRSGVIASMDAEMHETAETEPLAA